MVRLHTAQLNIGKMLKSSNVLFIDATQRSGDARYKPYIAPTWDLVHGIKSGQLSQDEYRDLYLQQLNSMSSYGRSLLEELAHQRVWKDVVLGCYCAAGKFCHRHLLSGWLQQEFGAGAGVEVTKDRIRTSKTLCRSMISIVELGQWSVEEVTRAFGHELDEGAVLVLGNQADLEVNFPGGLTTECAYERAMISFLSYSSALRCAERNAPIVLDLTGQAKHLFHLEQLEGQPSLLRPQPNSTVSGLIRDFLTNDNLWKIVSLADCHTSEQLAARIHELCYCTCIDIA